MNEAPKNRGGRPRSPNPKHTRVVVKMTDGEKLEAERIATVDGVSVADVLRRPLRQASHISRIA